METKQVSLTIPKNLFRESLKYSEEFGYESLQEFIRDMLRRKVIHEKVDRYSAIEVRMKEGKGVKKFSSKKEALDFLKGL